MNRRLRLSVAFICFLLHLAGQAGFAQTANFSFSPSNGCAPLVVNFTDLSTGPVSSYSWNLGNSVTSTLQHPSTTYTVPGPYTISLTITTPTGSDTKTLSLNVYDQPAVSFAASGPASGCTPHNVQFNSSVTANAQGMPVYNWDFGDGTTGSGANPAHTYVTPGTYTVSLTVINSAGCSRTVVQNAYVTAYPIPAGGFSTTQNFFCSTPATTSFTNTSTGATAPYITSWSFGDGGTSAGSSISHTYTTSGNFTVTMIATDAHGCADTVVNAGYVTVVGTLPTFTCPATVCQGVDATFTNTTSGNSNTFWNFGDGQTMIGSIANHAYMAPGTYTVTMSTSISGCAKTTTQNIIVNPKPAATINMSPSIPCPAPVTVTFSGSSVHAVSYDWIWYSGGTASGQTVSKLFTANIRDTVMLITTSSLGCLDTVIMDSIMIREIGTLVTIGGGSIPEISGCVPHFVYVHTALRCALPAPGPLPYPVAANSWLWDFGDGKTTSTMQNPSYTYVDTGDFIIRCIVTTYNGCKDTGYSATVHVDSPTHPGFIALPPVTICPGEWVEFINTTARPLPHTIYQWTFYDRNTIFQDTLFSKFDTGRVWNRFERSGTYSVALDANHRGCWDAMIKRDIIVVNPPDANFKDSIFCPPSTTVKFINTSLSPTSQLWFFGDGDTSTAFSPTHTYAGTGNYTVTLVAHNNVYGCSDTVSKEIFVVMPVVGFAGNDSAICKDELVRFKAGFGGASPTTYSWLVDNVRTPFDTSNEFVHQFPARGRYDVTLYVISGQGCRDSLTKQNYILVSQPEVNFGADPPIGCKPLPVLFVDSTTNTPGVKAIRNLWVFGNGDSSISVTQTINKTYPTTGIYTVRLIVTDTLYCTDSLMRTDYVSVHKPQAMFAANVDSVCNYQQILFTSTSTGTVPLRNDWNFGDGTTDTGYTPSHGYVATGIYTVRLIVTDSVGCSDTLIRNNYITVSAPHAAFAMSDTMSICPPLLVRFSNQSTAANDYRWDFGMGGAPVIVTNPVSTYGNPGVFNIILVAMDIYGCTDTAIGQVRVLGYSGAFSYTPVTGCVPLTVTFTTPLSSIPQITWDFGDGVTATSSSTTATHTYLSARAYLPKVIFSDGAACASSSFGVDTIRVDQVEADFRWSVPCVGTAFTLRDTSTALYTAPGAWAWYFGGPDTAAGSPVSYTFTTPGSHPVTMVVANATGCKDTITKNVLVHSLPIIRVTNDTGVCPGDRVDLLALGGLGYTWSPAPDSLQNCPVCDLAFVHLDNTSPGIFAIYTVHGRDENGCVNSDSTKVFIQLKTTSSTGAGGAICVGESFRLHAEGAHKYEWMPAESLDSPFIASPLATPQRTTTYIVAAQEGTCLIDSQYVQVVVHSNPLFSAGNDETIALGSAVTLKPTRSGITRIEWFADSTLTCWSCFDPAAHPHYTTTYYATGYNEYGCSATDSVTVHVRCNGSLVFIPNTFTPNGDGQNDYFFPRGEGIDRMSVFRVFNRWGELIFDRTGVALNDERAGWDGTYKGKALPPDVYVYTMQSTCSTGDVVQWKGDISIMK